MDPLDFPVSFPLGIIVIHERVLEEDREVTKEPIGFVHFKDKEEE
jgi:hypothetical protein